MNSVITSNAIYLAQKLREARKRKAVALLNAVGAAGLAMQVQNLRIGRPDRSWLNHIADRIHIRLKNPQKIDELRAKACNKTTVGIFFDRFQAVMSRPRCLILNCDETHISSSKHLKVVTPTRVLPLTRESPMLPHFSAMCTISASGHAFEPTIIVPQSQNLPSDLHQFTDRAYFIRTDNGWMTQVAFLLYCHILIYQLSIYRQTLPIQYRGWPFLLILDGHGSRFTYDALNLLNDAGVDVLILPAHCTHVLQPFDVSVASSLKSFLKKFMEIWKIIVDNDNSVEVEEPDLSSLVGMREELIDAFLKAWSSAATLFNIESGFRASGIWPLDRNQPLENDFVTEPDENSLYPGDADNPRQMHCALVTSDAVLEYLKTNDSRIVTAYTRGVEVAGPIEQLSLLLNVNDPEGTGFGGPSPFAPEAEGRRWFFGNWTTFSPAAVWVAHENLGVKLATLVICHNFVELQECLAWFAEREARQLVFYPDGDEEIDAGDAVEPGNGQSPPHTGREPRRRGAPPRPVLPHKYQPWLRFQDGEGEICLTTGDSLSGLHSVRRLQLIYTFCPTPTLLGQTDMGSNNIFIGVSRTERRKVANLPGFQERNDILAC
jgi:hypothetical protein